MSWDAVIFDFDGVLGQTMEDNFSAWHQACLEFDIELKKDEYFLLEGLNVREVARTILVKNGVSTVHLTQLAELKEQNYLQNNRFALYPGANEILSRLKTRLPLGLVTGAGRRRLEATLPEGFIDQFSAVITGDLVERPKPYPEPYLKAVEALEVKPQNTIAVENAPMGIESAKSAGLYCIAITSTLDASHLGDADTVVASLEEAGAAIADLI